jgi:hypothetical protein
MNGTRPAKIAAKSAPKKRKIIANITRNWIIAPNNHAMRAPPQPTLCRLLMKYQAMKQPRHGIQITSAMRSDVTKVEERFLFSPLTNPSPIPRKIACIMKLSMKTKKASRTTDVKPKPKKLNCIPIPHEIMAMESYYLR